MIPAQLIDFMCYEGGKTLIGSVDVAIPEIAFLSETITGAGIAGEVDMISMGQLQSMTTTIKWRSLLTSNAIFIAPKAYHLEFWGSQQEFDNLEGVLKTQDIKFVIRGIPKKFVPGNFVKNSMMETNMEFEILYLKLSIDGVEVMEADKFNSIFKVNGEDYLTKVRQDIGRS